jgi:octaheme c-type cytochrome (tetrathionate reductase family)
MRNRILRIGFFVGIIVFLLVETGDRRPATAAEKSAAAPVDEYQRDKAAFNPENQLKAIERSGEQVPFVTDVRVESPPERRQRLLQLGLGMKDLPTPYFLLDSPLIKREENRFGPVRFMHGKHAAITQDCSRCHHLKPAAADAVETIRCSACHQESFHPDHPERLGLKAAYHLQCGGCHQEMGKGPVDCTGCHGKAVPDHKTLVNLPDKPEPTQVTNECLRCHETAGKDMLTSAHWLWKGPSPYTLKHQKEIQSGKATNTINNFCIALAPNWPRCTSCHAGYGWKDASFDFTDMTRMDCLICHDTTGTYKKDPPGAGMPDPKVDLVTVAHNVGKTSRKTCGDCHFQGGGGDAVKHADMSGVMYWPTKNCDVHMGGYDFSCAECHKTRNHKIAGRSTSAPVAEGSRSCEDCHTATPHYGQKLLDHHLNRHTQTLACNACHSPVYSKCKPTKTWWDWSKAGDKSRKPKNDKSGMPDYSWMKGEFEWKESAKPSYAWYNGYMDRLYIGDSIDLNHTTPITRPAGTLEDPRAKIYPFKIMKGIQPADAVNRYLLIPHLYGPGGYWDTLNWEKAFETGMKSVNLPYSGKFTWTETEMYWGIHHEVMPKTMALTCVQCHEGLKGDKTCNRCHQDSRNVNFKELAHKGTDFSFMAGQGRDVSALVGTTDYIDFKSLGYKGDPIVHGGRFKQLPLGRGNVE